MNEKTVAPVAPAPEASDPSEADRLARRMYLVFCIASFLFVTLIVLIGTLLVM